MSYPPHIPLTKRKALSGRLLYYDVAPQYETAFIQEGAMGTYNSFEEEFFDSLDKEVTLDHKNTSVQKTPLDKSLREALTRFKRTAEVKGFFNDYPHLTDALFTSIKERVSKLSCNKCSPLRICDGVDVGVDDEIVAMRGLCIAQLKEIFVFCLRRNWRVRPPAVVGLLLRGSALAWPHARPAPLPVSGLSS